MTFQFHKYRVFLDQLSNYQLLKMYSAEVSYVLKKSPINPIEN
jgi:hypothetical protein